MIKNIQKILNVGETKLRYRKKETMEGLYFKEMLSKLRGSKYKEDNHKDSENKKEPKEDSNKEHIADSSKKEHEGEGSFLDELC